MRLRGVDPLETDDVHRSVDGLQNHPGPCSRKPVHEAAIVIEDSRDERERPHDDRIQPDERIENKIRPQAAEPAVVRTGDGMWTVAA